jgi:hypothetical protein
MYREVDLTDFFNNRGFPLTHPQKRVWIVEHLYSATSMHTIAGVFAMNGRVDFRRLERIGQYVASQEGMRLQVVEQGELAIQQVAPAKQTPLEFLDFIESTELSLRLEEWGRLVTATPFRLVGAPPYSFVLAKIDAQRQETRVAETD